MCKLFSLCNVYFPDLHIHTEIKVLYVYVGCSFLVGYSYLLKQRQSKLSAGCSFVKFCQNFLKISCLKAHVIHQKVLKKIRTFLPLLGSSAEVFVVPEFFSKNDSTSVWVSVEGLEAASVVFCPSLIARPHGVGYHVS